MSSHSDDGGPAFPASVATDSEGSICHTHERLAGMSLRDYFAGQALASLDANDRGAVSALSGPDVSLEEDNRLLAKHCWAMADAMLAARNR